MPICHYCHSFVHQLTQQCFGCGWTWHAGTTPRLLGEIDWKLYGLKCDGDVVAELCEADSGERYITYRMAESYVKTIDYVIETEKVPSADFRSWRFQELETKMRLAQGQRFYFDANGYWQIDFPVQRLGDFLNPWVGPSDGLVTRETAMRLAREHALKLGIRPFQIESALLVRNRNGEPEWQLTLDRDNVNELIYLEGFPFPLDNVVVSVDAMTEKASATASFAP